MMVSLSFHLHTEETELKVKSLLFCSPAEQRNVSIPGPQQHVIFFIIHAPTTSIYVWSRCDAILAALLFQKVGGCVLVAKFVECGLFWLSPATLDPRAMWFNATMKYICKNHGRSFMSINITP